MSFIYTPPSLGHPIHIFNDPIAPVYTSVAHADLKLEQKTIDEIESRIREVASKQRKPVIKRETISVPGPEGRRIRLVRRLPTPKPDIIERTYVVKPQKDEINIIVERPTTPPSQLISKTVVEEPGLPEVTHQIVKVPARNIPREINLSDYAEMTENQSMLSTTQQTLAETTQILASPVPSAKVSVSKLSRQPSVTSQITVKQATPLASVRQTPVKQRTPSVAATPIVNATPVKTRTPSLAGTPIAQTPIKRASQILTQTPQKEATPQPQAVPKSVSHTSIQILKTPIASNNPTPLPSSPVKQISQPQTPINQEGAVTSVPQTPVKTSTPPLTTPIKTRTPSVAQTPAQEASQSVPQTPIKQVTPPQSVPQTPVKQPTPPQSVPQTPVKQPTPPQSVPQTPVKQPTPPQSVPQTPIKQVTPPQSVPQTPVKQPTPPQSVPQTPVKQPTPPQSVPQTPVQQATPAQSLTRTSSIQLAQTDSAPTPQNILSRQPSIVQQQSAKQTPNQSSVNVVLSSSLKQVVLTPEDYVIPIVHNSSTTSTVTLQGETQQSEQRIQSQRPSQVNLGSSQSQVYYSIPLNVVSTSRAESQTRLSVTRQLSQPTSRQSEILQQNVEITPFPVLDTTNTAAPGSTKSSYSSLKSSYAAAAVATSQQSLSQQAPTQQQSPQIVQLPSANQSKSGSLLSVYGLFKQ